MAFQIIYIYNKKPSVYFPHIPGQRVNCSLVDTFEVVMTNGYKGYDQRDTEAP